ncbi:hypothetical protein CG719_32655 [Streptomyces sp. CB01373]|nr:hypothetical protein CG719_32655 [Streptomyces sp. CB01373]
MAVLVEGLGGAVGSLAVRLDAHQVGGPAQVDAVGAALLRVPDAPLQDGWGQAAVQADEAHSGLQGGFGPAVGQAQPLPGPGRVGTAGQQGRDGEEVGLGQQALVEGRVQHAHRLGARELE